MKSKQKMENYFKNEEVIRLIKNEMQEAEHIDSFLMEKISDMATTLFESLEYPIHNQDFKRQEALMRTCFAKAVAFYFATMTRSRFNPGQIVEVNGTDGMILSLFSDEGTPFYIVKTMESTIIVKETDITI